MPFLREARAAALSPFELRAKLWPRREQGPALLFGLIVLSVALSVALAESYEALAVVSQWPRWVAAAAVHTVLAVGITATLTVRGSRSQRTLFSLGPWWGYLPAAVVLFGSAALAGLSFAGQSWWPGGEALPTGAEAAATTAAVPLAWLWWVPLVEELVFRLGIGGLCRRIAPGGWGVWFSALIFALVHSDPTVTRLLHGQVGLALGPLLLGLACESLLAVSGSLGPGLCLHVVCNGTVLIFAAVDGRWLSWLRLLYS